MKNITDIILLIKTEKIRSQASYEMHARKLVRFNKAEDRRAASKYLAQTELAEKFLEQIINT